MNCEYCGREREDGLASCPGCGAATAAERVKRQGLGSRQYCYECAAPLVEEPVLGWNSNNVYNEITGTMEMRLVCSAHPCEHDGCNLGKRGDLTFFQRFFMAYTHRCTRCGGLH